MAIITVPVIQNYSLALCKLISQKKQCYLNKGTVLSIHFRWLSQIKLAVKTVFTSIPTIKYYQVKGAMHQYCCQVKLFNLTACFIMKSDDVLQ